jgi:integrase
MMNVREVTIAQPLSQIAAKALLSSASQREIAVLNAMPEETKERMQFFHDSKLRPNSKLALASDERALKRFLESKHSDVTVPQCSYGTVVEYLLFLHSEGKTQSTMKRALSSLKKLCPSLTDVTIDPIIRRGYKDTISSLMKSREKAVRGKDPVHEEEMWAMVDALQGTDAVSVMGRAYILLSWCSAARLNELRNLTVGDLQWVKSGVVLQLTATKAQVAQTVAVGWKRLTPHHCPLVALQAWLLMRQVTPTSYVFTKITSTGDITERISSIKDLTAYLKVGAAKIGIADVSRVSNHSQRKGFATSKAETVALHLIQLQTRHKHLSTLVDHYIQPCGQSAFAAGF